MSSLARHLPLWPWLTSLLAHALILGLAPGEQQPAAPLPLRLEVQLAAPAALTTASPAAPLPAHAVARPSPLHAPVPAPLVVPLTTAVRANSEQAAAAAVPSPVLPAAASAPVAVAPSAPPELPLADSELLSHTLWGLMDGRKRYPLLARRMGLEGRVVLEALINERGQILEAKVQQSAGSEILDQDALALLRAVAPIRLERYRLAPQTRVLIPVAYQLR